MRALAALLLWFAAACSAHAHAVLLGTEPGHRAVLAAAPARIVLHFNEAVTPIAVRVLDAAGRALELPAARAVDRDIVVELPAGLANGTYVVSYRVTSADGHPVGGAILFAVGAAPERWSGAPEDADAGTTAWRAAAIANRGLNLLSLFISAGGLLFFAAAARRPGAAERALLAACAAVAAVTAVAGAYLHAAALAGAGDPASPLFWRAALAGPQSASAAITLVGLALAFVAAPRLGGWRAPAARLGGAIVALAASAVTGHSAAAGWLWWPIAALHLVAAGFWFGALLPLIRALAAARASGEAAAPLQRFSRVAVPAVAALALCGLALALERVDSVEDLVATDYGRLVLAKIAGAAALIALAAFNKLRLTPAVAAGAPSAAARLRLSIGAEFVLMAGVVGLAATLAHTDPHAGAGRDARDPHAQHRQGAPDGVTLRLESGDRVATIALAPARPGRNTLTVSFSTRDGAAFAPLEASLELSLPAAGIEPFTVKLAPQGQGKFAADLAELALAGRWQLRLDALVSDYEKAVFRGEIDVR